MSTLTELGEYEFHRRLAQILNSGPGEVVVGDDCALVDIAGRDLLLASVDRLPPAVPSRSRAALLVVQALSDIICMGGVPLGVLVAVEFPRETSAYEALEFIKEVERHSSRYGCSLIGGDTKEGAKFTAVCTALGIASTTPVRRTPVVPGQALVVTLTSGRKWGWRWASYLADGGYLDPSSDIASLIETSDDALVLPVSESRALINGRHASAGTDLSDGIGGALRVLQIANQPIAFNLNRDALTDVVDDRLESVAIAMGMPLSAFALSPGHMWENLYTIHHKDVEAATAAVAAVGGECVVIGHAVEGSGLFLDGVPAENVLDAASDEKFRGVPWAARVDRWYEAMIEL